MNTSRGPARGPSHGRPIARATPAPERWWLGTVVVASLAVVAGTFLPWLRSGSVWRNSYELWRSAGRLGVVEGGAAEAIQVAWFLLPVAAGAVVVAVALDRPRIVAALALGMAALAGLGAGLALRAPLPSGSGATIGALGAATLAVAATGSLVAVRRGRR